MHIIAAVDVVHAKGKRPPTDLKTERFTQMRMARTRQHARSIFHWNTALKGLAEQASKQPALLHELKELLAIAGFPEEVIGESAQGYSVPKMREMPSEIEM